MIIKEGQMLELKNGVQMPAEDAVKMFTLATLAAALEFFADQTRVWKRFVKLYNRDHAVARRVARDMIEKADAFEDLLAVITREREDEHE